MSERAALFAELATSIEGLRAFKPTTKAEVSRWYEMSRIVEETLRKPNGLSPEIPSILWRYLFDADIRLKDDKYAQLQDAQMRLLVQYLKRGEMPSSEELKEYSQVR
jgi:hypothetical protein